MDSISESNGIVVSARALYLTTWMSRQLILSCIYDCPVAYCVSLAEKMSQTFYSIHGQSAQHQALSVGPTIHYPWDSRPLDWLCRGNLGAFGTIVGRQYAFAVCHILHEQPTYTAGCPTEALVTRPAQSGWRSSVSRSRSHQRLAIDLCDTP